MGWFTSKDPVNVAIDKATARHRHNQKVKGNSAYRDPVTGKMTTRINGKTKKR